MTIELKDARKQFAAIGYKLKTKRYSDFIGCDIIHKESGRSVPTSVLSREDYDFHKNALDLRAKLKRQVFEGLWRVVL